MDAASIALELDALMPSAFDPQASPYRLLVSDAEAGGGAIVQGFAGLYVFIDYYAKTLSIEAIEERHLDKVVSLFAGISRILSEPDAELAKRFKARIERGLIAPWGSLHSIRESLCYFYNNEDIFIAQYWPRVDLLENGEFEAGLDGWTLSGALPSFNVEDRINGTALVADGSMSISQTVSCSAGLHALVAFFSRTAAEPGAVRVIVRDGGIALANRIFETVGVGNEDAGMAEIAIVLEEPKEMTIEVSTVSGKCFILDNVRFGRIDFPSILVTLMNRFEVFYDGTKTYNGLLYHNGYNELWKNVDLDSLIHAIKPTGVYAEIQTKPHTHLVGEN